MNHAQLLKPALACAATLGMAAGASVAMAQAPMKMTPEMMKMAQQKTMMTMKKGHYVQCYGIHHRSDRHRIRRFAFATLSATEVIQHPHCTLRNTLPGSASRSTGHRITE
jgi:hypothetical protein